jgi:hypothetical protein
MNPTFKKEKNTNTLQKYWALGLPPLQVPKGTNLLHINLNGGIVSDFLLYKIEINHDTTVPTYQHIKAHEYKHKFIFVSCFVLCEQNMSNPPSAFH